MGHAVPMVRGRPPGSRAMARWDWACVDVVMDTCPTLQYTHPAALNVSSSHEGPLARVTPGKRLNGRGRAQPAPGCGDEMCGAMGSSCA
eukprot:1198350-Prymnesium_polylepis.1